LVKTKVGVWVITADGVPGGDVDGTEDGCFVGTTEGI